jgi:hypothetical protein
MQRAKEGFFQLIRLVSNASPLKMKDQKLAHGGILGKVIWDRQRTTLGGILREGDAQIGGGDPRVSSRLLRDRSGGKSERTQSPE